MSRHYDCLVAGGGVAGAVTAALMGRLGLNTALVDLRRPGPVAVDSDLDPRVVAISPGSRNVLDAAGVWKRLDPARIGSFERMQVCAGLGQVLFSAREHGLEHLGWIVELPALAAAAWADLEGRGEVELIAPAKTAGLKLEPDRAVLELDGGGRLESRIVVAADGARSRLRQAAGIGATTWYYNQKAVITHLETTEANPGIAWQRFTEAGPLALLPLPAGRSSLVWSVAEKFADELRAADPGDFIAELNRAASDSPMGPVTGCTRRYAIALVRRQAEILAASRLALLGDAARTVHPLAGQGLNLGLLDAATLAEALEGWKPECDPEHRLARYNRRRISSGTLMAGGIHAFNELTAGAGELGRTGLGLGFEAIARLWPAREAFVLRACGIDAGAPALARGA